NVKRALDYEVKRQSKTLRAGGKLKQETRLFNQSKNATVPMRTKEQAHDYRYFPDPDLVPVVVKEEMIQEIKNQLPELPEARRKRFIEQYSLTEYDAVSLCSSYRLANYFEQAVRGYPDPKKIANWVLSELLRVLNDRKIDIDQCPVRPHGIRELFVLMDKGEISGKIAKKVFDQMIETGKSARQTVEEKGLKQVTDKGKIDSVVDQVLEENQSVVEEYRNGKKKAFGFLVGQVMKKTRGKANPRMVNQVLNEKVGQAI
ncbi:MAG: Asp-tRNA(Asn)/Glu-tRNA(Gln) amidotransferase GatCAB subunit B, partial [Spirochaetota bacterium]